MNARPYILGCLCLVGATGTAAASDIDPFSSLFSMGGAVSSSFEGSGGHSQGGSTSRDSNNTTGGDVMSTRPGSSSRSSGGSNGSSSPTVDPDDANRDGPAPIRAPAPSWQSLLPGSML